MDRPQELEQVLTAGSSTGREEGHVVHDVGEPLQDPQEDEHGRQTFAPTETVVALPLAVVEKVPVEHAAVHWPASSDRLGSLQDVHVVADPSQVPHDESHATHDPLEAKVPAGQDPRHLPSVKKAPSEQAVHVTALKLEEDAEKVGRLASEHSRGAASQRPLTELNRNRPEAADVPVELVGSLQTPESGSMSTQAAEVTFVCDEEGDRTKSPLPLAHFVQPVGPADEQVVHAESHGSQDVLFALKKPGEQAETEVVEPARVKGAG